MNQQTGKLILISGPSGTGKEHGHLAPDALAR